MEGVRQLVQEEGREARNLVAFHVAVDIPGRNARKPPRGGLPRRVPPRPPAARLRSASAGRDKRSELRARYWALLFGDLQRAIGEIYNTVEAHENLSECQEVILVLENYTRDFKALCEWFKLKWEYDNTPPPQRPQSLAWEIRKTDFVRPESRKTHSVRSSPSVSGKNSPSLSGHNTPSGKSSPSPVAGKASPGSGKLSPRHPSTSPKSNVEFFGGKISGKVNTTPEPKSVIEPSRLSDIKEKVQVEEKLEICILEEKSDTVKSQKQENTQTDIGKKNDKTITIELGTAKCLNEFSPKQVIIKNSKPSTVNKNDNSPKTVIKREIENSSPVNATITQMDKMETEFLNNQLVTNQVKNENMINEEKCIENETEGRITGKTNEADNENSPEKVEIIVTVAEIHSERSHELNSSEKDTIVITEADKDTELQQVVSEIEPGKIEQDAKRLECKAISSEAKPNVAKPAYSQAAAKPKCITAGKIEIKLPIKANSAPLSRSKTVVDIRPNTVQKIPRQFSKRSQASKCSYPFNLTTGRTSLFDSSTSKFTSRKLPIRNTQLSSGDSRIKLDMGKMSLKRPTSLRIDDKGDKIENDSGSLEKLKKCDEYSSSDTIVTQIDMSRIESSESLKTLVPDDVQFLDNITNSIEVLNLDGENKNDNEGWFTVKSRRLSRESKKHSKSHWANRFHQPSATTSLPTLNMLESPKQEDKTILDTLELSKNDRAKSEQPQIEKPVQIEEVKKPEPIATKNLTAIIRQKSDVTGLRTKTARNKVLSKKVDRVKGSVKNEEISPELTKNRLHSSLESLTTALSRSQESTEDLFDFDKWKTEFKSTFQYLEEEEQIPNHNELLMTANPSEMSEIAEMTSQIEENERKISLALDFQSEVDQRKLCAEEDLLNRQIRELQQVSDIDMDTETDDTETDAEILCEDTQTRGPSVSPIPETLGPLAASLEDQYEPALAGLSWAERVDTLATLEALVARYPGRAQQLHAKLSQGMRRRGSLQETLKRYQVKQARAEQQRQVLQTERTKRIHQLLARVEEVKVAKNQLIEHKRLRMERRLQKAAENRDQHLKDIVRKAHDEEEKLREIAFIKQLEAEHRRHDFLQQCGADTARLRTLRRDQLHKLEQAAAREAAVGARRRALEAARTEHVQTLLARRRLRDARCQLRKEQRDRQRGDAARERAEGVKSRLSALAAAAELEADALRSRIQHKQDASQQRLATHLQAIRSKATAPRPAGGDDCTSVTTITENQDNQETKDEPEENVEQEMSREKLKAIKKRARKLKQKLLVAGQIFEDNNTPHEKVLILKQTGTKMCKVLSQLNSIVSPFIRPIPIDKQDKKEDDENEPKWFQVDYTKKRDLEEKRNEALKNENTDTYKAHMLNADELDIFEDINKATSKSKSKKKSTKKVNGNNEILTSVSYIDLSIKDDADKLISDYADAYKTPKSKRKNAKKDLNNSLNINDAPFADKKNKHVEENVKSENISAITVDCNLDGGEIDAIAIDDEVVNAIEPNENTEPELAGKKKNKSNKKRKNSIDNGSKSGKNKKGNKNQESDGKFTKAVSECSTISDACCRNSYYAEKRLHNNNHLLDMTHLERTLNEMLRVIEKMEKDAPEKLLFQKVQGVRTLGYLLSSAVDRHDTINQLSPKALIATIQIIARVIAGCTMTATYFLGTNGAVYAVRLLLQELERDLTADRECTLAVQLADCVSVALDSVLCLTRVEQRKRLEGRPIREEDRNMLVSMRHRAQSLISYLCCGGVIARTERAGDARESVQTLLTMCANLCRPSEFDVGNERAAAAHALRVTLGRSLGGARAQFCALFAGGGALGDAGGGFVRAARIAHLLRSLAELDHTIIQEAFGEGGWPLEFRAAVARLLSEHAPNDREAPRQTLLHSGNQRLDQTLSETMVLDLIVLIGFFVVNNPQHQETVCVGWSAVRTLCMLPAGWIVSAPQMHALLPTLLALKDHPAAGKVIEAELSCQMLEEYLVSEEASHITLVQLIKEGRQKLASASNK